MLWMLFVCFSLIFYTGIQCFTVLYMHVFSYLFTYLIIYLVIQSCRSTDFFMVMTLRAGGTHFPCCFHASVYFWIFHIIFLLLRPTSCIWSHQVCFSLTVYEGLKALWVRKLIFILCFLEILSLLLFTRQVATEAVSQTQSVFTCSVELRLFTGANSSVRLLQQWIHYDFQVFISHSAAAAAAVVNNRARQETSREPGAAEMWCVREVSAESERIRFD